LVKDQITGRTKSRANVDNDDGDESKSSRKQIEDGQDLSEQERKEIDTYMEKGGTTEIATYGPWTDTLSLEMKEFFDQAMEFEESLRGDKKIKFQAMMNTFKHASSLERSKEDMSGSAAGSSSSSAPVTASDKKHELVVANAGANAHFAAKTQGKSEYKADAEMAKAMSKQEEKRAEQLQREMEDLKKKHEEALQNAQEQHKKELVSVAKDAKEKALQDADKLGTRSRKQKASEAAEAAEAVEQAVEGSSAAKVVLPAAAANSAIGELLRSNGIETEVSESDNKRSKSFKAKASSSNDDASEEPVKRKNKRKLPVVEDDDAEPVEPKKRAKDFYAELHISGPSKLGEVVERIGKLKERIRKRDQTIAKDKQKYAALRADRIDVMNRFAKAKNYMLNVLAVDEETLYDEGILMPPEEDEEEEEEQAGEADEAGEEADEAEQAGEEAEEDGEEMD